MKLCRSALPIAENKGFAVAASDVAEWVDHMNRKPKMAGSRPVLKGIVLPYFGGPIVVAGDALCEMMRVLPQPRAQTVRWYSMCSDATRREQGKHYVRSASREIGASGPGGNVRAN